jgi:hypothetical protein
MIGCEPGLPDQVSYKSGNMILFTLIARLMMGHAVVWLVEAPCYTSWKVAVRFPVRSLSFLLPIPSIRTMAMGLTHSVAEMCNRNLLEGE